MTKSEIKVWRINEYEWWAGTDLESIGVAYEAYCGIAPEDPDGGFDNPYQLTEVQLSELLMEEYNEDFGEAGYKDDKPTFREYLDLLIRNHREFPRMLASTEY